jgi:hypothetical protein
MVCPLTPIKFPGTKAARQLLAIGLGIPRVFSPDEM